MAKPAMPQKLRGSLKASFTHRKSIFGESKIDFRYLKEAFKEPLNFWGMAGFAIAAAYVQDVTPLLAALAAEAGYLAVVPATPCYRRLGERREIERARRLTHAQLEAPIKDFD